MQITPYLAFNGQCREAFEFYQKVLGGTLRMFTYGESPMAQQTPPEQHKRVMHAGLSSGEFTLAGADAPPQHYSQPQGFSVTVSVSEPADAERIFNALAEGGNVKMPIQETFWAKRFGMVTDRFGTHWMVNCEKPM